MVNLQRPGPPQVRFWQRQPSRSRPAGGCGPTRGYASGDGGGSSFEYEKTTCVRFRSCPAFPDFDTPFRFIGRNELVDKDSGTNRPTYDWSSARIEICAPEVTLPRFRVMFPTAVLHANTLTVVLFARRPGAVWTNSHTGRMAWRRMVRYRRHRQVQHELLLPRRQSRAFRWVSMWQVRHSVVKFAGHPRRPEALANGGICASGSASRRSGTCWRMLAPRHPLRVVQWLQASSLQSPVGLWHRPAVAPG